MQYRKLYLPQIDVLKGAAIISVVLLHTLPRDLLIDTYAHFHIWQAVPVFFILMGITLNLSFLNVGKENELKIRNLYTKAYLKKRIERILVPFLFVFLISLIYGVIKKDFYFGWLSLIGRLPVIGNGNYFASILIQYIFLSPVIYYVFQWNKYLSIILFFIIEIGFQLLVPYIPIFAKYDYLYSACILRYLSAIGIGLYISAGLSKNTYKRLLFIYTGVILSIIYLFFARNSPQPFSFFWEKSNFQNAISYFYPAFIVVLILNIKKLDTYSFILSKLALIGKASYHIFLVQMLFFGFNLSFSQYISYGNRLVFGSLAILLNLAITISIGLLFYFLQQNIISRYNYRRQIKLNKDSNKKNE